MADGSSGFLAFAPELVVDLFAGGGGASTGLTRGYRAPDVAVNHDPLAIAVHTANHPGTRHYQSDVFEVDPIEATGGEPVAVLWASPDCRHHSRAKGGKPVSDRVRSLAWVVVKWAKAITPRLIFVENVPEFREWGPCTEDGRPCPKRAGTTFKRWKAQLENLGYLVEWRELVAASYGAPTIRKRLFLIARLKSDGQPIVWPKPTHSRTPQKGQKPWRTAAECIDFDLPAESIFGRSRPLAENTLRRIAAGLVKFVLDSPQPFIVPLRGTSPAHRSTHHLDVPLSTVCASGTHHALTTPTLVQTGYGERNGQAPRALDLQAPLGTVVACGQKHALATAHWVEQANGGPNNTNLAGRSVSEPLSTVCTAGSQQRLAAAHLIKFYSSGGQWAACSDPMHTVPTVDRMGLVVAEQVPVEMVSEEHRERALQVAALLHRFAPQRVTRPDQVVVLNGFALVDISLRMLTPRELARAQGFPDDYALEKGLQQDPATGEWREVSLSKRDQVRLIGNSVCPAVAEALVRANCGTLIELYRKMAA